MVASPAELVGAPVSSSFVRAFIEESPSPPTRKDYPNGSCYLSKAETDGWCLSVRDDRIVTVFLYSDRRRYSHLGKHLARYQGALPFGISLDESRDSLRKRFGVPTRTWDNKRHSDMWELPDHGLLVDFTDDSRQIVRLAITMPTSQTDQTRGTII